jgi:hypothetical protein
MAILYYLKLDMGECEDGQIGIFYGDDSWICSYWQVCGRFVVYTHQQTSALILVNGTS